ncbi:MAG TPA: hypothetical protein VGM90_04835 [Kofleriaceae bacterium]|jgi:hypothetical protein
MRSIAGSFPIVMALAACHGDKPAATPPPAQLLSRAQALDVVLDPALPLRIESLGSPVRSSRIWTSALVANKRGGWNFIAQIWESGVADPAEFVVLDLDTGRSTARDTTLPRYANSNFSFANQLRAPNGRVFFPLSNAGLAYYDPTDETVHELPPVTSPPGADAMIYSARFGSDGMLYGGTQSGVLPAIVQIDPDKLTTRVVGRVGRDRKTYSYAYRLAVDPPWIYTVVGEMPWELAALNIKTGESRILATRADHPWMDLHWHAEGWQAQLVTGLRTANPISDYVWLVDGKTIPVAEGQKLPFKSRNLPPVEEVSSSPEVDVGSIDPDGVGKVRWRPRGGTTWKTAEFKVNHTTPVPIEALTAVSDGSVLGAAAQYHGFFRTTGSTSTYLGGPSPSRSRSASLGGLLYTAGYPNGVLYAFDPSKPWVDATPEKAAVAGSNPYLVGNFTQASAKYGAFLTSSTRRLYFTGWLERDGEGSGIGYYDPASKTFGGHHDGLLDFMPAGLAALPAIGRVVFSGRLRDGAAAKQAELVVYDENLVETERLVVKPGLTSSGDLYATSNGTVILGVLPNAVYRYDIAAKKQLGWRDIATKIDAVAMRPNDNSLWATIGTSLVRIDTRTLEMVTFGGPVIPPGVDNLVWQGDDLYATAGTTLYRFARIGLR